MYVFTTSCKKKKNNSKTTKQNRKWEKEKETIENGWWFIEVNITFTG